MTCREWTEEEDNFLRENFDLTNQKLAAHLKVDPRALRVRYAKLGIERPSGKNPLARARNKFCRERVHGLVPIEWHELPLTRMDAKFLGESFYWDGRPCDRAGHMSRRKTSSGGCWECEYSDHRRKVLEDEEYKHRMGENRRNRYSLNTAEYLKKQREYKKGPVARSWQRKYENSKRKNDLNWRLAKSLRDRLYKAVSRESKSKSSLILVGCSINQLREHLERQFTEGMSWDNYGDWHIDHIRPCISFDLNDPEQQTQCFHFSNLAPLWGEENRSKGGIWDGHDPRRRK